MAMVILFLRYFASTAVQLLQIQEVHQVIFFTARNAVLPFAVPVKYYNFA